MQSLTPNQAAALNIEKSISLTANAGSGKTSVLIKRYLEVVLKNDISLNRIAAITFTEKAAGELYNKIAEEINRLAGVRTDNNFQQKINSIRNQLVSAKISTIHSFCLDILRDFPVEAELDANFIPIDNTISTELIERSTEEVITESLQINSTSEVIKKLIRLFGSKFILARELNKLIIQRKNVLLLSSNLYNKTEEEIAKYFRTSFFELLGKIISMYKADLQENIEIINNTVLKADENNLIALEVFENINLLKRKKEITEVLPILGKLKNLICTESRTIKIRGYLGQKSKEEIPYEILIRVEVFFKDFDSLIIDEDISVELELAAYGKLIVNIFSLVLDKYEKIKKENGFLDFEDILLKTKNILLIDEVRNQLVDKYKYLLVDEYQDTNEIQYQIFLPIVDYLKRNNLFVVGDEKQSIYKFRDAELEIFGETKKVIRATEGKNAIMSLPDSFRMSPAICLFTNILFQNLFKNPSDLFNEVEHSNIICAADNPFEGKIEFLLPNEDETEAQLVAKRILNLMNESFGQIRNWNQIAVLVRKRNSFDELEKIFTKFNIPFTIVGGKGFFQRQNIYDIYNYFSFLLDRENNAALVGVLRSPFYNVSDSRIYELSLEVGNNYFEKINTSAKSDDLWKKIYNKLDENLNHSKRMELPVLLRKILDESGFLAVVSSKADRKQELGNINKLIKMTIDFSNEGFKSLYDYVNYLRDAIENLEDISQASVEKENEGVNILTIHQAKGLEFEAVFLFNCNDTSQRSMIKAREISINKKYGLLMKVPVNQNYFGEFKTAAIVSICNLIEDKKELAELKRLLYVAITRAKSFLFISSITPENGFKERSFMNLIESGLECDFKLNEIKLNGNLTYLKQENNEFINFKKDIQINISFTRELKNYNNNLEARSDIKEIKKYNFQKINDRQGGEIISASKISLYSQCPVKYQLAYKFGLAGTSFGNFNDNIRSAELSYSEEKELKSSEQIANSLLSVKNYSLVKGRIIHSILEKKIDESELPGLVRKEIELLPHENQSNPVTLEEEIIKELGKFYESNEFEYLSSLNNFNNEAEIYIYENDYLFYGIIDKLIFDRNKLIVVDYKTDNVDLNEIKEKAAFYKNQILFYLYIASIKFSKFSEYEGRLIFIKAPDLPIVFKWNAGVKSDIQKQIRKLISDSRENNFVPNRLHCPDCIYAVEKKECILEKAEPIN